MFVIDFFRAVENRGIKIRYKPAVSEDRGGMHHSRPLYDRPADLSSQIEAGRPAWQPSPPPSGHPALRRTRRTGCPLDAKRFKWHMAGVRCAAPIGTNEIWRAIWLRWLELSRGRSAGRHFGEVAARPAPPDRRRVRRRHATFGTRWLRPTRALRFKYTMQARSTDGMAWSNGRGQITRSPTDASQATLIVTCPSCVVTYPYLAKIFQISCRV